VLLHFVTGRAFVCRMEFIGTVLILVGSALYLGSAPGNNVENASAAAILWFVGGFVLLAGMILLTVLSLVVASVTALMPEMLHRQRAWFSIAAQILFTFGVLLWAIGAAAFVVETGPGFQLFGSLLWLLAGGLWFVAFLARLHGAWYYFVPVLSFATAAAATSMITAGTAAQVGLTGTAGSHVGSIESTKTVVTTDQRRHSGSQPVAAPVIANNTAAAPVVASTTHATSTTTNTGTTHPTDVQVAV
jgi:hypothetical protein